MDKIGQNILKNFKEIEVITLLFDFSSDTSIEAYEDLYKKKFITWRNNLTPRNLICKDYPKI